MTLQSAAEDFQKSLSTVPGRFRKLIHVSRLLRDNGTYEHWGIERTYGREAMEAALYQSHRHAFEEILHAPLSQLLAEGGRSDGRNIKAGANYWAVAEAANPHLLPGGSSRAARLHFSSVLLALSSLEENPPSSSHRAA